MALYGALLLIVLARVAHEPTRARGLRLAAIGLTVGLVALIGFSRVYLAVHFPTDVLGAWILVAAWLAILSRKLLRE